MLSEASIKNLRIISYPDPILRKQAKPIETFDTSVSLLTEKMWELMHQGRGVGLAGPQVGLSLRIFVWNPSGDPKDNQVAINPKLENLQGQTACEEGCLSVDGVNVEIKRAEYVEMQAQLPDGSTYRLAAEGLPARIWQHENDHLDGRLIVDYMSPAEEIANRRAIKELTAKHPKPAAHKRKKVRR